MKTTTLPDPKKTDCPQQREQPDRADNGIPSGALNRSSIFTSNQARHEVNTGTCHKLEMVTLTLAAHHAAGLEQVIARQCIVGSEVDGSFTHRSRPNIAHSDIRHQTVWCATHRVLNNSFPSKWLQLSHYKGMLDQSIFHLRNKYNRQVSKRDVSNSPVEKAPVQTRQQMATAQSLQRHA